MEVAAIATASIRAEYVMVSNIARGMLPLGVMLLAIALPFLKRPTGRALVRLEQQWVTAALFPNQWRLAAAGETFRDSLDRTLHWRGLGHGSVLQLLRFLCFTAASSLTFSHLVPPDSMFTVPRHFPTSFAIVDAASFAGAAGSALLIMALSSAWANVTKPTDVAKPAEAEKLVNAIA
jgi:hypothetical protein